MIKTQSTILLAKVKTGYTALFGIFCAFFFPLVPFLLTVGLAILVDTYYGIRAARKLQEPITSKGLSRIVSKMVLYQSAVVLLFCLEKVILGDFIVLITAIPFVLTKIASAFLIYIELTSISESYQIITGISIWDRFKKMVRRTGETRKEINKIFEDEKK
jgi:holin family protein